MAFINQAVTVLQTLVIALGAGLRCGVLSASWRLRRQPGAKSRASSSSWLAAVWC